MRELSVVEEIAMSQRILTAASNYAVKVMQFKEQLESRNPILNDNLKLEKSFDIESLFFIQETVIMIARQVTGDDKLATYQTLNDDIQTFKEEVNNSLNHPYRIYFKDGTVYLSRLEEEVVSDTIPETKEEVLC